MATQIKPTNAGQRSRDKEALDRLREIRREADRRAAPILADTDRYLDEHAEEIAEAWKAHYRKRRKK